jgi:hypothetical protein
MNDKFLFLIFYIEVTAVTLFIIKATWSKRSQIFYAVTNLIAIVVLIALTLVLYQQFFISEEATNKLLNNGTLLGNFFGIMLYLTFLLASLGIIFAGAKSIKEKESISIGPGISFHRQVKGNEAIIEGVKYLIIGGIFLFGVLQVGIILFK